MIRFRGSPEDSWLQHLDKWRTKRATVFPSLPDHYDVDYDKVHEMTEEEYMVMKLKYSDLFWFMEIVK